MPRLLVVEDQRTLLERLRQGLAALEPCSLRRDYESTSTRNSDFYIRILI